MSPMPKRTCEVLSRDVGLVVELAGSAVPASLLIWFRLRVFLRRMDI